MIKKPLKLYLFDGERDFYPAGTAYNKADFIALGKKGGLFKKNEKVNPRRIKLVQKAKPGQKAWDGKNFYEMYNKVPIKRRVVNIALLDDY